MYRYVYVYILLEEVESNNRPLVSNEIKAKIAISQ